ncbi:MAG: sigma-70 family RNA polymerase sigma factor [Candidatus Latescibacteria bacterium]|nr:sigma-70 family RNA polymerase sigma factor [Candidatus Latescibacterota bacterium]
MTDVTRDLDCLRRIAAGDEAGLSELYDRYIGLIFPMAVKIVGDNAHAEDVVQEVWMQVWRSAPSYDPKRGPVAAWLLTITRSRALDVYRSRSARAKREDVVAKESVESGHDPGAAINGARKRDLVRRAFAALEPKKREVLELAYWHGLSQSEIAVRVGAPLGTVKSWMRQGLRDLRASLPEGEWW